jgi:hypothetical protein
MLNLISDGYERKARFYPAILLISPVILGAIALLSPQMSGAQSALAALIGFGGSFLLAQLARDAGKKGEQVLYEKWGGQPSIAIFRHSDPRINAITKARYHKKLAALVKEAKAPSTDQEKAEPLAADIVYAAWSEYLRVNTRDTKKFSLLLKENISYGYRRNIWGLRLFGATLSFLSAAVCGSRLFFIFRNTGSFDSSLVYASIFAAMLFFFWMFRFTADWVRVPADAYAARLAESAEVLSVKTASEKASPKP